MDFADEPRDGGSDPEIASALHIPPSYTKAGTHDDEVSSSSGEEVTRSEPYASLLGELDAAQAVFRTKKRKRKESRREPQQFSERGAHSPVNPPSPVRDLSDGGDESDYKFTVSEQHVSAMDNTAPLVGDQSEKSKDLDPFETHFAAPDTSLVNARVEWIKAGQWISHKKPLDRLGTWSDSQPAIVSDLSVNEEALMTSNPVMKARLRDRAEKLFKKLDHRESAFQSRLFEYRDVFYPDRTVANASTLRSLLSTHIVNHVLKTRDRVLKNNERISRQVDNSDREYRDQGFTRPKVLILLPTKNSCCRYVDSFVASFQPEQQENRKKFQENYVKVKEHSVDKPADYLELFAGDDDDAFRLGINFTRKTLKLFTQFYRSDVIVASPLGLRRAIERGDPKTNTKPDSDFLSSIELVVIDQADALLMQVWEHVEFILQCLNQQPKAAHDCDFSRVRDWYLEGNAALFRQTVMLSAFATPELNTLCSRHMNNVFGRSKYAPDYQGAAMESAISSSLSIKQTFARFQCTSPADDPDTRFNYFTSAILPNLVRLPNAPGSGLGVLIFIPSYFDFVRIRNFFSTSTAAANLSFGTISENQTPADADIRRARTHFASGRHSILLYSGRAHHFFRYRLKGVRRVVFYSLPENPTFYREIVGGFLGRTVAEGTANVHEVSARAMFSKWDILKLERVIGSSRLAPLLRERSGDVFDFV